MRASSYLYAADCYTAAVLISSSIGGSRMFSVWFWSLWFLSFLLFFAATILASAALICFAVGRAVVPYFGLPPRGHQMPLNSRERDRLLKQPGDPALGTATTVVAAAVALLLFFFLVAFVVVVVNFAVGRKARRRFGAGFFELVLPSKG